MASNTPPSRQDVSNPVGSGTGAALVRSAVMTFSWSRVRGLVSVDAWMADTAAFGTESEACAFTKKQVANTAKSAATLRALL